MGLVGVLSPETKPLTTYCGLLRITQIRALSKGHFDRSTATLINGEKPRGLTIAPDKTDQLLTDGSYMVN